MENLTLGTTNSTKLTKSSQVVHNLPAYLTQEDWTKLQSNTTIMDQLAVIAKRLAEMGVYSLKENTKQQAVALVLKTRCDQGHQEPSANIIYSWKDDFQACHTGVAKGAAPSMAMYPAMPVNLGSNWLSKAYLENSQPLGKDVFIAPWMEKVAVRSTNSLLQSGGTAPKPKGFKSQSSQGNLSTIFVTAMPWSRNFLCGKTFQGWPNLCRRCDYFFRWWWPFQLESWPSCFSCKSLWFENFFGPALGCWSTAPALCHMQAWPCNRNHSNGKYPFCSAFPSRGRCGNNFAPLPNLQSAHVTTICCWADCWQPTYGHSLLFTAHAWHLFF